jgi:hypothetical protein
MARTFVVGLLRQLGEVVFGADDARAEDRGWQVAVSPSGLGRTYRHPGFDQLAQCSDCQGSGLSEDRSCGRCKGTGRVRLTDVAPVRKE